MAPGPAMGEERSCKEVAGLQASKWRRQRRRQQEVGATCGSSLLKDWGI